MEYVDTKYGFEYVCGTNGKYMHNGEIVINAKTLCIVNPIVKTSGNNNGKSYYKLHLGNGKRSEWCADRVFLGINNSHSSTQKISDSELIKLNGEGYNDSQIARLFDMDQTQVSKRRRKLNLPTRHETNEERHAKAVAFYGLEEEMRRHKNKRQWKGQKERYMMKCEQHGVEYDESVNLQDLVKRDGITCSICGIECSFTDKRWGNFGPTYPTMDHIIPLSKGGSHTWDNVQIACGECNCHVKRDKLEVVV